MSNREDQLDRATARMGASYHAEDVPMTWAEARHLTEHTLIGQRLVLAEAVRDLRRAVLDALPAPIRRLLQPTR